MISVDEALNRILSLVRPVDCESIPLAEAAGRILAEHVVAERDQPPFNASSMDGYALRSKDLETHDQFEIIGESPAGRSFEGIVASGQTVRIFTGARMPEGSDRVIIQEDVCREGARIRLNSKRIQDAYVRYAGGDFRRGDRLEAPTELTPARLSLAASMNAGKVVVRKRPVIAFIPNGDELAMPGSRLHADQVVASNTFGLRAILESAGARFRSLPIARDNFASLSTAFEFAGDADLIVTSGGASVGEYDLVRQTAGKLGMQTEFYKVAMRPGKPLMAGRLNGTPIVGLPGNPVSSLVCGYVFLVPAVRAMLGLPSGPLPRSSGILAFPIGSNGPREHYMRAKRSCRDQANVLHVFEKQDSSLISVLADADALAVRPPNQGPLSAGDPIAYIPLN